MYHDIYLWAEGHQVHRAGRYYVTWPGSLAGWDKKELQNGDEKEDVESEGGE